MKIYLISYVDWKDSYIDSIWSTSMAAQERLRALAEVHGFDVIQANSVDIDSITPIGMQRNGVLD